jgi:hypothetical protein
MKTAVGQSVGVLLTLLWSTLLWSSLASASTCEVRLDGLPAAQLDCTAGGAWTVWCALPEGQGKIQLRVSMPDRQIEGVAKVPLSSRGELELPLAGPGGRAGAFVVERAQGGLLAGQTLGPNQWCPVVQPEVVPGAPRATHDLMVVLSTHKQTGFAERVENGVSVRQPTYDAGTRQAAAQVPVLQRPVGSIPVLTGPEAKAAALAEGLPQEDDFRGKLQLLVPDGSRWATLSYKGKRRVLPVLSGEVSVLVVDFVAPEVADAVRVPPAVFLEEELGRWLAADPSSLLGVSVWARSGFEPELLGTGGLPFRTVQRGPSSWREASIERMSVRVTSQGDVLRAVIAWRPSPWDDEVRSAVDVAASQ